MQTMEPIDFPINDKRMSGKTPKYAVTDNLMDKTNPWYRNWTPPQDIEDVEHYKDTIDNKE